MNVPRRHFAKHSTRPTQTRALYSLGERRNILKTVLNEQIKIAEMLSESEGIDSTASRWAWDVVEEISKKLTRVEDTIWHTYYQENERKKRFFYHDEELSTRMYDL